MKKQTIVIILAGILFMAPMAFIGYSKSVYNTAQCVATFEGQSSLPCVTGGSDLIQRLLYFVSFIGLLILAKIALEHFIKRRSS